MNLILMILDPVTQQEEIISLLQALGMFLVALMMVFIASYLIGRVIKKIDQSDSKTDEGTDQ